MASTPQNVFVAGPILNDTAPCASSAVFNQGDIVKVSSNLLVVAAAVADVIHGIVDATNPTTSLLDTVTRAVVLRPGPGVLVRLPLKSGDVRAYDDLVYISSNVATNPQEVSSSSASSASIVGRCRELASVTGDGLTRILVEFTAAA